jgi:hypothetical protein
MNVDPNDRVMLTVARRTKKNLDFIYTHKDSGDVYEFTQLVNSMLAMIISMRAEYFNERRQVTWDEVANKIDPMRLKNILSDDLMWENLQIKAAKYSKDKGQVEPSDLFSDLIDNLRNAFAHCCWEFYSDRNGEINGLNVWNVRYEHDRLKQDKRYWRARVTEAQLRALAYIFIEYLEVTRGHEFAEAR